MIDQVDAALGDLIRAEALAGWDADVVFDAPDREWSGRRTRSLIDAFLYDVREDTERRESVSREVRDSAGRVVGRKRPPRTFTLSYLLTTWSRLPADEHRLLAQLIVAFLRYDQLPAQYLVGALAGQESPVLLSLVLAPRKERSVTDIWSVLGGQLHPSLDLSVTVSFDPSVDYPIGPPVTEQPDLRAHWSAQPDGGFEQAASSGPTRPFASPTRDHIEEP